MAKKQPEFQPPVILTQEELMKVLDDLFQDISKMKSVMDSSEFTTLNSDDQRMAGNLYRSMQSALARLSMSLTQIDEERDQYREWMTAHRPKVEQQAA